MASYLWRLLNLDKILIGLRAFTIQSYTEANVKNGTQFSASSYFTGLTAGENLDFIIITGSKPVTIKAQYTALENASDVLINWYRNPTYTGGTEITSAITNQSDINPVATTVRIFGVVPTNAATGDYTPSDASKPTVTAVGTRIQPLTAVLGNSNIGSGTSARSAIIGLEQVLAPNTTYLFRRTCVGTVASLFGFSTWYEGGLDLPADKGQL